MNNLLLFFALPVATIILAVVLQKNLQSPILVAATAFAIYLIVTFAVFDSSFLIFAILYTVLAFISAYIACLISRYGITNCSNGENSSDSDCGCNTRVLRNRVDYNFYNNESATTDISNISSNDSNFDGFNKNCSKSLYRCRK